jgi:hypothetical protein
MLAQKDLIPLNQRTKEEQKKICSKGGKKSGEVRREQKTYREMAKAMLSATITDENILNELQAYGLNETDVKAYTLLGMIKASGNGSHNAFDRLMELIGEKEQNQNENVISKLDKVLGDIDEVMNNGET